MRYLLCICVLAAVIARAADEKIKARALRSAVTRTNFDPRPGEDEWNETIGLCRKLLDNPALDSASRSNVQALLTHSEIEIHKERVNAAGQYARQPTNLSSPSSLDLTEVDMVQKIVEYREKLANPVLNESQRSSLKNQLAGWEKGLAAYRQTRDEKLKICQDSQAWLERAPTNAFLEPAEVALLKRLATTRSQLLDPSLEPAQRADFERFYADSEARLAEFRRNQERLRPHAPLTQEDAAARIEAQRRILEERESKGTLPQGLSHILPPTRFTLTNTVSKTNTSTETDWKTNALLWQNLMTARGAGKPDEISKASKALAADLKRKLELVDKKEYPEMSLQEVLELYQKAR